jgi:hypothetical protein
MENNGALEIFARTVNDMDDGLPKGRSRCFDIGSWGGCGAECGAFIDGECGEPQEIERAEIIEIHGADDAEKIMSRYDCFDWQGDK